MPYKPTDPLTMRPWMVAAIAVIVDAMLVYGHRANLLANDHRAAPAAPPTVDPLAAMPPTAPQERRAVLDQWEIILECKPTPRG